ncbi:muconolactone Delta-isomerase family protein [Streptomyces albiaxialis]|uniref:Muconolactone Delta-isomerase family protein n=2 Tax=Streptomyces albiaxialis TaxID=329523 RepID=A0ABP5IQZ3_9ACTN
MVMTERFTQQFTEDEFAEVLPQETEAVREMYADGAVRQIWLRGDTRGACFLLEADSLAEAEAAVSRLPLARREMSEFRVIPLQPYGGFGPR